jgi:hypothetical protein
VKPNGSSGLPALPSGGGSFAGRDAAEYSRMRRELVETVEKLGGYEPAVDDIHIDIIVRHLIYLRKIEAFLNAETATESAKHPTKRSKNSCHKSREQR